MEKNKNKGKSLRREKSGRGSLFDFEIEEYFESAYRLISAGVERIEGAGSGFLAAVKNIRKGKNEINEFGEKIFLKIKLAVRKKKEKISGGMFLAIEAAGKIAGAMKTRREKTKAYLQNGSKGISSALKQFAGVAKEYVSAFSRVGKVFREEIGIEFAGI